MKNLFDLQLFAEEETTEVSTDPQQQDEIPEELAGYDEDVRREIMAQIKPEDEAPKEDEAHTEDPPAETDSDNKTVEDVLDEPTKAIPYKRFKEVNDKAKSAAQEAAQLKEQLATLQARIQQPVQPPVQQVQQPVQQQIPQGPRISPELAAKINEIAYSEALQMSGLTKEEVTALEYAEDNDPKIQTWKGALDFARTRAWTSVDTEFRNRQLQAHTQLQLHQQIVNDFESFTQEQEKEADFQQIREYAVNDLYSKLAPLEQQTIAEAYRRVENKTGSPQDVYVIKQYFSRAAADYRSNNASQVPQDKLKQKTEKLKQMDKHPKVEQISGTSSAGDALTVDKIENMVNTVPWDKIPLDIRQMLVPGEK